MTAVVNIAETLRYDQREKFYLQSVKSRILHLPFLYRGDLLTTQDISLQKPNKGVRFYLFSEVLSKILQALHLEYQTRRIVDALISFLDKNFCSTTPLPEQRCNKTPPEQFLLFSYF